MAGTDEFASPSFLPVGTQLRQVSSADVASVAGLMPAPKAYVQRVTGALAITGITLPYAGFEGTICYIPTGAFTLATGGAAGTAIAVASTAVVAKAMYLTFLAQTGLWYPSY